VKHFRMSSLVVAAALILGACGSDRDSQAARSVVETSAPAEGAADAPAASVLAPDPITVVTGFGVVADLVRSVGGDAVEVTSLAGPGVEAHDLELTPDQVRAVGDADLVVYLGSGFQPSLENTLKQRSGPSVDLLTAVELLAPSEDAGHSDEHSEDEGHSKDEGHEDEGHDHEGTDHESTDPHFWLDPIRFGQAGRAVAVELGNLRPGLDLTTNAAAFEQQMSLLHSRMAAALTTCKRRDIVTAHTAFGYLAAAYNLNQIGIVGVSPDAEPSAQRMRGLTKVVKEKDVTTVFTEELVSARVAEALAREANVKTAVLSPIETFTEDELEAGATYTSKMQANLTALRAALDCA
jgi:zinc transport system substrate-binding protein